MTAMNTLAAIGPDLPEMPRFDDGMVNIRELIRTMAEAFVNEIMDAQAEDACADGNQRNGYRDRALVTSVGVINLRIPKLRRGSYFPEDLLVRYSRVDRAVIAEGGLSAGSGPHERQPGVAHLRVAGRRGGRPAGAGPVRRRLPLRLGGVYGKVILDGHTRGLSETLGLEKKGRVYGSTRESTIL